MSGPDDTKTEYTCRCPSPLGGITLSSDGESLTGLWFDGQKFFGEGLPPGLEERELEVFDLARRWLGIYFDGREPDFTPPLRFSGTPFRERVWRRLQEIPYGETVSYGELAKELAACGAMAGVSAQAVGGAVGHNPISLIVPCHRVVGAAGELTGYAAGIERKIKLLTLEGVKLPGLPRLQAAATPAIM